MPTSPSTNKKSVRASAPGRANLIGEHVDYAGGVVLPFAISNRTYADISLRDDDQIRLQSTHSIEPVELSLSELATWDGPGWARYPLGVLHVLRNEGIEIPGMEIAIESDVPQGAGLSSSAALECAVATGLNELLSSGYSKLELAKFSQRAENKYVGMPCGLMDQATSMLAKEANILRFDCLSHEYEYLPFNLEAESLEILLIDSRMKHELVDGGYATRFAACESARATMGLNSLRELTREQFEAADLEPLIRKRISHVISEMERVEAASVALQERDFTRVGELMNQSHASLRDLYEVSSVELDLICEIATTRGALGARMMGGGFGGSAIVLTPTSAREEILSVIDREFENKNYTKVGLIAAAPSEGARVEL